MLFGQSAGPRPSRGQPATLGLPASRQRSAYDAAPVIAGNTLGGRQFGLIVRSLLTPVPRSTSLGAEVQVNGGLRV